MIKTYLKEIERSVSSVRPGLVKNKITRFNVECSVRLDKDDEVLIVHTATAEHYGRKLEAVEVSRWPSDFSSEASVMGDAFKVVSALACHIWSFTYTPSEWR